MNSVQLSSLALAVLLAAPAAAEEPNASSVLVYPVHHSDADRLTLISVTNTHTWKSVRATFRYVLSEEALLDSYGKPDCLDFWRGEVLTPADTITVSTLCHAGPDQHGYLLIGAYGNPGGPISHNYLVGSLLVLEFGSGFSGMYQMNAAGFDALAPEGQSTDADFDGRLDFDGVEYEMLPDDVILDSFIAAASSRLSLINLADDRKTVATVGLSIWNDNEQALSSQIVFRCWFELDLPSLGGVFTESFLANNTLDDTSEVDWNCDGFNDFETGWVKFSGLTANGSFQTQVNPPLLGSVNGGRGAFEGGRLLWGSNARSSGQF